MGTKNNPGQFDCYEAADPDEPMFVLLARDPLAPWLLAMWAAMRRGCEPEKVVQNMDAMMSLHFRRYHDEPDIAKADEALACAHAMLEWRRANRPPLHDAGAFCGPPTVR